MAIGLVELDTARDAGSEFGRGLKLFLGISE